MFSFREKFDLYGRHRSQCLTDRVRRRDLVERLGITKWEEPENNDKDGLKIRGGYSFPEGVYKTDETNCKNLCGHIENKIGYPIYLIGTVKIDGSSISLIVDSDKIDIKVGSRSLIKPMTIEKVVGVRTATLWERIKEFFGCDYDYLIKETVDNDDKFIELSKPYIEKIKESIDKKLVGGKFILRGEGNGQSWKGSGNKNNPSSKNNPNIKFYGIDDYSNGISVKFDEVKFNEMIEIFGFERCEVLFKKTFNSREEIEKECNDYFKTNMVEGIVLRTQDSKFSAKFMNDFYDSKK